MLKQLTRKKASKKQFARHRTAIFNNLRTAFLTNDPEIVSKALILLQKCLKMSKIGRYFSEAVGPLLRIVNKYLLLHKRRRLGDAFDFKQINADRKARGKLKENIVELILETLDVLHKSGANGIEKLIRQQVPTYQYVK